MAGDETAARRRGAELAAAGAQPLFQESVAGPLVAWSAVADNGRLVARVQQQASHLWPPAAGVSARGETVVASPQLSEACECLLEELRWSGLCQLQFIVGADGTARLVDFNGRLYGSLALAVAAGVNLPALWAGLGRGGGRFTRAPDGRPAVRYQWLEGELRWVLENRSAGALARVLAEAPRSVHSVTAIADPAPALVYTADRVVRAWQRCKRG